MQYNLQDASFLIKIPPVFDNRFFPGLEFAVPKSSEAFFSGRYFAKKATRLERDQIVREWTLSSFSNVQQLRFTCVQAQFLETSQKAFSQNID